VLPADVQDRDGAQTPRGGVRAGLLPRRAVIWADGAYTAVVDWALRTFGWVLTTILRPVGAKGHIHLPRRWIVERTFGWFGRYRRLSKDYETNPRSSEAWIDIAMIHRMARAMLPNRRDENRLRKRPKRRKIRI
jgi:putative transposase